MAGEAELSDGLSPLARLALAYAPAPARGDWLTWLALDARLAGVVRTAREPVLAQLKLAWWRDRLVADPTTWPKGEPLLARLAGWDAPEGLVALVDGWEALLSDPPLAEEALAGFAHGRAAGIAALAARLGTNDGALVNAARRWSLAELALHREPAEAAGAAALLAAEPGSRALLARTLRPLAVLERVTGRALARGGAEALYSPGAWFAAVRVGLLGR